MDEEVAILFPNVMEIAHFFEQGGVGVGQEESYRILLSLKTLLRENTTLQSVRFWGQYSGVVQCYGCVHIHGMYVAELLGSVQWCCAVLWLYTYTWHVCCRASGVSTVVLCSVMPVYIYMACMLQSFWGQYSGVVQCYGCIHIHGMYVAELLGSVQWCCAVLWLYTYTWHVCCRASGVSTVVLCSVMPVYIYMACMLHRFWGQYSGVVQCYGCIHIHGMYVAELLGSVQWCCAVLWLYTYTWHVCCRASGVSTVVLCSVMAVYIYMACMLQSCFLGSKTKTTSCVYIYIYSNMLLLYAAGKIFGTRKDYIIAEAEYQEGEGEEEEEEEGEDEGIQLYRAGFFCGELSF